MPSESNPGGHKKLPQQVRRRNSARITTIPVSGRSGPVPKWPLDTPASKSELGVWKGLWSKPQAVIWEAMGMEREVALYCKVVTHAEQTMFMKALAEARQLQDRLLLNPRAMFLAQVQLVDDDGAFSEENITDIEAYRKAVSG